MAIDVDERGGTVAGGYDRIALFAFLRRTPIFSRCTDEQLGDVEACSRFEQRPADDELVREGDAGDAFYVLVEGKASVVRGGAEVANLGPGDTFGELALFDPAPRNATVRATEPVWVVVIDREPFQRLLATSAPIRDQVLRGMAHRLHEVDAKV